MSAYGTTTPPFWGRNVTKPAASMFHWYGAYPALFLVRPAKNPPPIPMSVLPPAAGTIVSWSFPSTGRESSDAAPMSSLEFRGFRAANEDGDAPRTATTEQAKSAAQGMLNRRGAEAQATFKVSDPCTLRTAKARARWSYPCLLAAVWAGAGPMNGAITNPKWSTP